MGGTEKADECRLCPSDMRFFEHELPFNVLTKALKVCNSLFTRAFGLGQGVSSRDPHRIRETTSVGKPDGAGRGVVCKTSMELRESSANFKP
jgi:hypothetical protein